METRPFSRNVWAPLTLGRCAATLTPTQATTNEAPAIPARLTLRTEHCKQVRVRLTDLGLHAVQSATRDGAELPADAYAVADGTLTLLPDAPAEATYEFTF